MICLFCAYVWQSVPKQSRWAGRLIKNNARGRGTSPFPHLTTSQANLGEFIGANISLTNASENDLYIDARSYITAVIQVTV